jgi:hypothetical protein
MFRKLPLIGNVTEETDFLLLLRRVISLLYSWAYMYLFTITKVNEV